MPKLPLRRHIRGGRPFFFTDPATDKILNMVVTLASEVWSLRERLAAMQAIGEARGTFRAGEVDAFEFSQPQEAQLAGERKEFIENLFRVLGEPAQSSAAAPRARRTGKTGAPRSTASTRGKKARRQQRG